jgi:hypothetical protein
MLFGIPPSMLEPTSSQVRYSSLLSPQPPCCRPNGRQVSNPYARGDPNKPAPIHGILDHRRIVHCGVFISSLARFVAPLVSVPRSSGFRVRCAKFRTDPAESFVGLDDCPLLMQSRWESGPFSKRRRHIRREGPLSFPIRVKGAQEARFQHYTVRKRNAFPLLSRSRALWHNREEDVTLLSRRSSRERCSEWL